MSIDWSFSSFAKDFAKSLVIMSVMYSGFWLKTENPTGAGGIAKAGSVSVAPDGWPVPDNQSLQEAAQRTRDLAKVADYVHNSLDYVLSLVDLFGSSAGSVAGNTLTGLLNRELERRANSYPTNAVDNFTSLSKLMNAQVDALYASEPSYANKKIQQCGCTEGRQVKPAETEHTIQTGGML